MRKSQVFLIKSSRYGDFTLRKKSKEFTQYFVEDSESKKKSHSNFMINSELKPLSVMYKWRIVE